MNILIKYHQFIINKLSRIVLVLESDHGYGAFRFTMKILCVMNSGMTNVRVSHITHNLCKKDNGIILKGTITKKLGD